MRGFFHKGWQILQIEWFYALPLGRRVFILASLLVFCSFVVWANAQVEKKPLEPIPTGQPVSEEQPASEKGTLQPLPIGQPVSEEQPESKKGTLQPLPTGQPTGERLPEYQPMALQPMTTLQGQDGITYQVGEFKDFQGGLDLVSAKTKVAPNCAIELENALWNPQGEMYKRLGYSEHSTPPEVLNFLYRYYQQDGDKWTMGGSDTALYFWHEDSSGDGWTYLIGTEGTEGRWDGTTFEDVFVGTHEGITPVVWNGSTFVELGGSVDSLRLLSWSGSCAGGSGCRACSTKFSFDPAQTGWDNNEWIGYTLGFWAKQKDYAGTWDTIFVYDYILSNTDHEIHAQNYSVGKTPINGYYARIYAWFQIDSIWREGTIDRSDSCNNSQFDYASRLIDSVYTWDSTFAYNDYVFEVVGGTGEGIITYLNNYSDQIGCGEGWNDSGFIVPTHSYDCFDTTTTYRIYAVKFWTGSKFVENFDGSLWLGWTGIGDEQEKNRVVWSGLNDLGNWPPANEVWIESDDGDYITGMAKFPGEYTDVPRQEMIVTKNNSLYKIVPASSSYDFWLIQSGVGCVSNSAISPAEGILLFPDQHGVWAYDKRKPLSISLKIDPIFEEWNFEELENVSAVYNPQDRHYYMSYPDTTAPDDTTTYCMITWEDDRDGDWSVYGQRFNYEMVKIDTNFRVDDDTGGNAEQNVPDIAVTPQHQFVFVWTDERAGVYGNIRMRRFNSDGSAIDTSIVVNGDTTNIQNMAHLDVNSGGKMVVVWEDRRGGVAYDIYAQRYDSSMSAVGSNFLVDTSTHSCGRPHIEIGDDGKFVISWRVSTDPDDNVFFQRYDSAGNTIGGDTVVVDSAEASPFYDVGSYTDMGMDDDDGRFLLVWSQNPDGIGGYWRVWGDRRDSAGTAIGTDFAVSEYTEQTSEHPSVAMNSGGSFVVCWDDFRAGGGSFGNAFCQRFDSYGNALGGNVVISDTTEANTKYNSVDIDEMGNFVVAWTDYDTPDDTTNLFMRAYTGQGKARCGITQVNDRRSEGQVTEECAVAVDKYLELISIENNKTLSWNIDYHGWSKETFSASAYCYQHSIFDDVKILFAIADTFVYNYGTQGDDIDDPVILTYQSPCFSFGQYPSFDYEMRYATVEAYLDIGSTPGNIYLTWYKNYSDSVYYDSLICGSDCREEMKLPEDLWGKNISMKLETGSNIDDFTLSRFWWEWTENQKFRK